MARKISADDVIEVRDTIRFIGRNARWVVEGISGTKVEISYFRKLNRRDSRIIIRTVSITKIELVRKGNADDDGVERFDWEMAASRGMTVDEYRASLEAGYREAERRQVERDEAGRARAEREAAEAAEANRKRAEREAAERAAYNVKLDAALVEHNGDFISAMLSIMPFMD